MPDGPYPLLVFLRRNATRDEMMRCPGRDDQSELHRIQMMMQKHLGYASRDYSDRYQRCNSARQSATLTWDNQQDTLLTYANHLFILEYERMIFYIPWLLCTISADS